MKSGNYSPGQRTIFLVANFAGPKNGASKKYGEEMIFRSDGASLALSLKECCEKGQLTQVIQRCDQALRSSLG